MFKFKKLKNKILAGYGLFLIIIVIQVLLSFYVNKKAEETHNKLTQEIKPKVNLLDRYRNANRVLLLLVNTKAVDANSTLLTNKIKQISEVDFPYFRKELNRIKLENNTASLHQQSIDSIVQNTFYFEQNARKISNLLMLTNDYKNQKKIEEAKSILTTSATNSTSIDRGLAFLQRHYNKELEEGFTNLSERLHNSSRILVVSTLVFVLLGVFFSLKITYSITKPLKNLMEGAKGITKGRFTSRVSVLGKDEIAELSAIFNQMSISLNRSFNDIKNKNKELEQFTYIASHDLQEPLRTLTNFVDLLDKNYNDQFDELGQKSLGYIKGASIRMSNLVKGLLEYSRIGSSSEITTINCNQLLQDVKSDLTTAIEESNATLIIEELPELKGYETELRMLFQNLISNAIKYSKPNVPPVVRVFAEEKKGWTFAVEDNGIGIEKKHLKRIFIIFQRLHHQEQYNGTGIGLAHCNKIAVLHKGTIWAKSVPDVGSTFYFNISKKL